MSNPHIQKEVNKIFQSFEAPKNASMLSAWIIAHFKGVNIKIYDTKEKSSLCDYNIIASAQNTIQAKSMVDELTTNLKLNNIDIISVEGLSDCEWVLVDAGDIIIHIFQEVARDVFDLDSLWHECDQVQIPQEYYFGAPEEKPKKSDSSENYF